MSRYLTLGFGLCLLSFVSGCCCGGAHGCGFRRMRRCNPCGYAPQVAPFGGCNPCNPCDTGMGGAGYYNGVGGAAPVYGAPGAYYQPYGIGTAEVTDGIPTDTAALPAGNGIPVTMGVPGQFDPMPPATALARPDSLATY